MQRTAETETVRQVLLSDAVTHGYWTAAAREAQTHAAEVQHEVWTEKEHAKFTVADRMKEEIEQQVDAATSSSGLLADLLYDALKHVNWHDIAQGFIDYANDLARENA